MLGTQGNGGGNRAGGHNTTEERVHFKASLRVPAGTHEYKFIVDGKWVEDPDNKIKTINAFGSANSVAQL